MNSERGYRYAGVALVSTIAEELILELFDGQVANRKQLIEAIVKNHCDCGGLASKSNLDKDWLYRALKALEKKGLSEWLAKGYWRIGSSSAQGYQYTGVALMPTIAEKLILEMFSDQTVETQKLVTDIVNEHCNRGGLPPSAANRKNCVKWALKRMRESGTAKSVSQGYWRISSQSDSMTQSPSVSQGTSKPPVKSAGESPANEPPTSLTLGSGSGAAYLYYYPRDKELAESKRKPVWECKIGMTNGDVEHRVKSQRSTAVYEEPEIGLEIRTDNPRALEKAIHAVLELKGKRIETSGNGNEWFMTSPNEVMVIATVVNGI